MSFSLVLSVCQCIIVLVVQTMYEINMDDLYLLLGFIILLFSQFDLNGCIAGKSKLLISIALTLFLVLFCGMIIKLNQQIISCCMKGKTRGIPSE